MLRNLTVGVHEDAAPADTAVRYPGHRIGREFLSDSSRPDRTLNPDMARAALTALVLRAAGPYLQAGQRVVVSFKLRPDEVTAGRWDAHLRDLGAALTGLDVEVVYWHEPENDLPAAVFARAFTTVRGLLKESNPALVVAVCSMAYQWAPGRAATADPGPWAGIEADAYYVSVYSGRTWSPELILPDHPGFARWHQVMIAGRAGRRWGVIERGFFAWPGRAAVIAREMAWLLSDPVGRSCSVWLLWATPGREKERGWVFDPAASAAAVAAFARLAVPAGFEAGPVGDTLVHTASGVVVARDRAGQWGTVWQRITGDPALPVSPAAPVEPGLPQQPDTPGRDTPGRDTPGRGTAPVVTRVPGALMDLSGWSLTTPAKGAPTVKGADLDRLVIPDRFYVQDGRVVFAAHAGGGTTPNTRYPRCELRELTPDGELASWSTTEGVHELHVMRVAVIDAPPVKPQVVFAQVHGLVRGRRDDVIEVMFDGLTDGGAIVLRYLGRRHSVLLTPYQLGTEVDLIISVDAGHISVLIDGARVVTVAHREGDNFFKTGAYVQSNPSKGDKPDALGVVWMRDAFVVHR